MCVLFVSMSKTNFHCSAMDNKVLSDSDTRWMRNDTHAGKDRSLKTLFVRLLFFSLFFSPSGTVSDQPAEILNSSYPYFLKSHKSIH